MGKSEQSYCSVVPALRLPLTGMGKDVQGLPRLQTFCGRAALATGRGTFPRLALRRAPSSNSYSDVIAWSPYGLPGSQR